MRWCAGAGAGSRHPHALLSACQGCRRRSCASWRGGVVGPSTLKQYVTGKGNSPKELLMLECFKRWGYSATDNNDCDAHCLMRLGVEWCRARDGGETTKRVAEVMAKLDPWAAAA